jgi:hypothetical protein
LPIVLTNVPFAKASDIYDAMYLLLFTFEKIDGRDVRASVTDAHMRKHPFDGKKKVKPFQKGFSKLENLYFIVGKALSSSLKL